MKEKERKALISLVSFKLGMVFMMMIFLIGFISSAEFDNVLSYEKEDLKVSFDNWFGLGKTLGTAELKSHSRADEIIKVPIGKNTPVMWYDFNFAEEYENGLGEVTFTNKDNNRDEIKDYYFAKAVYRMDMSGRWINCPKNFITTAECDYQKTGLYKNFMRWEKIENNSIPAGDVRIALITSVKRGDSFDGVWEIAGKKVDRHAVWTEQSLLADLFGSWSLNESSGTTATDNLHINDGLLVNMEASDRHDACISGRCIDTDDGDDNEWINLSHFGNLMNQDDGTFSVWYNTTSTAGYYTILGSRVSGSIPAFDFYSENTAADGRFHLYIQDAGGTLRGTFENASVNDGQYHLVTVMWDQTSNIIVGMIDGINYTVSYTAQTGPTGTASAFGWGLCTLVESSVSSPDGNRYCPDVSIDEANIWTRKLNDTEVLNMFNTRGGYTDNFAPPPSNAPIIVSQDFPLNNSNLTTSVVEFSGVVTDDINLVNVSLYFNGEINTTNSTPINASQTNFTLTLSDGTHDWFYSAWDNESQNTNGSGMRFTIDSTAPKIIVTAPNQTFNLQVIDTAIDLDWNFTDLNPDTCRFEYAGTNTTVTCTANTTTFTIASNSYKNLTFYANDTSGNSNTSEVSWDYRIFQKTAQVFTSQVTEGQLTTFEVEVISNGTTITVGNLSYNSTENIGGITTSGDNYTINLSKIVPIVSADQNITFFWNLTMADGFSQNLSSGQQRILNFAIDSCVVNTNVFYNFTVVDEDTQSQLAGVGEDVQGEVDLQLYSYGGGLSIENFSTSYNQTNPFAVCLNSSLATSKYNIDVQVQYDSNNRAIEFYHIQNDTLDSNDIQTNITLYDVSNITSQSFQIVFKDSSFLPVVDALIQVQRKYISEGVFKVVEIPKTDAQGEAIANLIVEDVFYTFVVVKNGVILGTFENKQVYCPNPTLDPCTIPLNTISTSTRPVDFTNTGDFSYTLTYNETDRIVTSVFSVPSSTVSAVLLNVTILDGLGTRQACTDTLTTSSGTVTCTIPLTFGNGTALVKLTKDGVEQARGTIGLQQEASDLFGASQIFMGVFLFLIAVGVGISSNPIISVILLAVGVILATTLTLIDSSGYIGAFASVLWFFIVLGIVLLKAGRRT